MYAIIISPHLPFTVIVAYLWRSLKQIIEGNGLVTIGAFEGLAAHIFWEAHLSKVLDLVIHGDLLGVVLGPLSSLSIESLKVVLVHLSHDGILRIICANGKHARSAHIIVVRN